jgi:hypothetical protein
VKQQATTGTKAKDGPDGAKVAGIRIPDTNATSVVRYGKRTSAQRIDLAKFRFTLRGGQTFQAKGAPCDKGRLVILENRSSKFLEKD